MKFEFSEQTFEKQKTQISIFLEIRPVVAELFRADGQTDGHNGSDGRFSQFWGRL